MAPLDALFSSANHSWVQKLNADPETEANEPNKRSREVKSGHFVRVKPTPLPSPKLIIHSPAMAETLGISESDCKSEEFAAFFSGNMDVAKAKLESWCTPYALAIMGQPMVRNCPFGNGNGYGDGRAVSVGEVLVDGKRWEMQLKGGGTTPFCRGADGRAVLRSSIREFLASEAMHNLGIETTRALSLVVSGNEFSERPWYSAESRDSEPDEMVKEPCAITTRVAPSFLRCGHIDLFARRASQKTATEEQKKEHQLIVEHALFREYPDVAPNAPLAERAASMLSVASVRFAELVAGWLRVGFCQGNFNCDNCLVGGRTMDYGPFGFMERYDPNFAKWVGSGRHFAFLNQPQAALSNFMTLADSVKPVLGDEKEAVQTLRDVKEKAKVNMKNAVDRVWREKLGFGSGESAAAQALWNDLDPLMAKGNVDYIIFFRCLAEVAEAPEEEEKTEGAKPEPQPGSLVRLVGLVASPELNNTSGTVYSFVPDTRRWKVALESGEKALKPENLEVRSSGDLFFELVEGAFYNLTRAEDNRAQWLRWLRRWRTALADSEGGLEEAAKRIRKVNPKYVPREWMLLEAYDKASRGDYSMLHELFELFRKPYDEQPEFEEKYFCCTPSQYRGKGGCEVMT
mmetsp:Transcript_59942/g.106646  ORF Transcript_59942/g.106646 Transcript_59942/m.106646 type:complete len:629 (+) Transcript_59942:51-1937(+)